jgi:long-chain acyl-CoA synthetase
MRKFLLRQATALCTSQLRFYAVELPKPFTNLVDLQQHACKTYAKKNMFGTRRGNEFKWITYAEFGEMVDNVRGGLANAGVKQNDAVAVIANNRVEWAACAYAAHGLGAHIVPMYEVQKPSEWQHIVKDSGAIVLFVASKGLLPMADKWIEDKSMNVKRVFCFEVGAADHHCFQNCMETGKKNPVKATVPNPDTLAALIYTSGTTGVPKGVELTHRNIASNVNGLHQICKDFYTNEDSLLSFLPWAHVYGQTVELHHFISMGASLGVATSPQHVLEEIPIVKPNILIAVPTVFNKIYAGIQNQIATASPIKKFIFKKALAAATQRRKELDLHPVGSLKMKASAKTEKTYQFYDKLVFSKIREKLGGRIQMAFSGGAALHKDVQAFFMDIGISIMEGYGLTETAPIIAVAPYGQTLYLQGGLGFFPGVELEIMDGDGNFLPRGEEGEIVATGPNIMKQYHSLPEATAEVIFEKNGKRYFKTGDMGIVTKEDKLRITGRVKELYKLENGKWVAPVVTEMAVCNSRFVSQVMMYGANRNYNILLCAVNQEPIKKQLNLTSVNADDPAVAKLVIEDIQHVLVKGNIKKYEAPQRVFFIKEEFSVENGLLTNKLSMKRNLIVKKYENEIKAVYEGTAGHALKMFKE